MEKKEDRTSKQNRVTGEKDREARKRKMSSLKTYN